MAHSRLETFTQYLRYFEVVCVCERLSLQKHLLVKASPEERSSPQAGCILLHIKTNRVSLPIFYIFEI